MPKESPPPLATDWVQLLLTPVWSAIVALLILALALVFRRPLSRLLARLGVARGSFLGVDVEWITNQTVDAYRERELPLPTAYHLRAFGILSAHLAPLVRNRRVLWVDDRPHANAVEAQLLRRLGVEIEGAVSTREALEIIDRGPAPFDLVISDWDRGGGDDVLDLAWQMGAGEIDVPIIVYTGSKNGGRSSKAAEAGVTAVTTQPDELLKHVLVELSLS